MYSAKFNQYSFDCKKMCLVNHRLPLYQELRNKEYVSLKTCFLSETNGVAYKLVVPNVCVGWVLVICDNSSGNFLKCS